MVSSFGLHYRNERTLRELLRIHPDEHPVSIQLFGQDPEVMRSAAAIVAEAGADLIDINMGCPVRKVCKTGRRRRAARATTSWRSRIAAAARRGRRAAGHRQAALGARAGRPLGLRARACGWPRRPASPRSASTRGRRRPSTRASPTTRSPASWPSGIAVPVIISGGLDSAEAARRAYEESGRRRGDDRPRLARQPVDLRGADRRSDERRRAREEIVDELLWVIDRAEEHLGAERAARYLRKFYPWYLERLEAPPAEVAASCSATRASTAARELIAGAGRAAPAVA